MATQPDSVFASWFRSVAPYFHAFRGRTFVIAFGGEVVADGKFVTSRGPGTAMEFALKLVEILLGSEKVSELKTAMLVR